MGARAVHAVPQDRTLYSASSPPHGVDVDRLAQLHRQVFHYWDRARGLEASLRRSALSPADLRRELPHLLIWDVEPDDYRCRLAGTEVDAALTASLKGVALSEIPCSCSEEARREFDAVRDGGMVSVAERTLAWCQKPHLYYRHLILPLSDARGTIHQLLSAFTVQRVPEMLARR